MGVIWVLCGLGEGGLEGVEKENLGDHFIVF